LQIDSIIFFLGLMIVLRALLLIDFPDYIRLHDSQRRHKPYLTELSDKSRHHFATIINHFEAHQCLIAVDDSNEVDSTLINE